MLHLRGSVRNFRYLPRATCFPKAFTTVRSTEIVVSEVKALASVAVKLYGKHELEAQLALLGELREEEDNKKLIVERFIEKNRVLASTWLPMWISKVVCLEDQSEHVKLFPVTAPVDDKKLATTIKNKLVDTIVKIKSSRSKSKNLSKVELTARQLTDALADRVNIDHLREIGVILDSYVNGGMLPTFLFNGLLESGGMFASEILPILQFANVDVPVTEELKFLAVDRTRSALHHQLIEELTLFLHIVHRNRFNESSVKKTTRTNAPAGSRVARTVRSVVDKDSLGYFIEHKADGGMVYIRKEPDVQAKMRFLDRYVFSVKAPCYARTKRADQPGIYDELNELLHDGKSSKQGQSAAHTEEDQQEKSSMRKVVVDNLPSTITAEQLSHALRKCGPIKNVWLYRDERTHPEEVKYLTTLTYRAAADAAALAAGHEPDHMHEHGEHHSSIIDLEEEAPAIQSAELEELPLSGAAMAAQLAAQDRLPLKHKMLKGITKTDSYAFVEMADDKGFANITKDAVRLFGIRIQNKSCRVLMAQSYKAFWVQMDQVVDVSEAVKIINEMFDGHFECYSDKESERFRPVYLQMQFEDSNECQRAFDLLLRRMEAMQAKGIAFERITYDAHHTKDYITKRIQLFPSWIKDSWYKEYFDKQTRAMLKKEEEQAQLQHEQLQQKLAAVASAQEGGDQDTNTANSHLDGDASAGYELGSSIDDVKKLVAEIKSMSFLAEPFKGDSVVSPTASNNDAVPLAPAKNKKNSQKKVKEVTSDAKTPRSKPAAEVKKTKTATEKTEKKASPKANKKE